MWGLYGGGDFVCSWRNGAGLLWDSVFAFGFGLRVGFLSFALTLGFYLIVAYLCLVLLGL